MALHAASSLLESGADVILVDRMAEPLPELWGQFTRYGAWERMLTQL